MARISNPSKGLEYFFLNVDADEDEKIYFLESKHGIEGFGIWLKLLMKIYKHNYYLPFSNRQAIMFARKINVNIVLVNAVIETCFEENIFSKKHYENHQILTSRSIQERYFSAVERRRSVNLIADYSLIDSAQYKNIINVSIKGINVNINSINENIGTQSQSQSKSKSKSKTYIDDDDQRKNEILDSSINKKESAPPVAPAPPNIDTLRNDNILILEKKRDSFIEIAQAYFSLEIAENIVSDVIERVSRKKCSNYHKYALTALNNEIQKQLNKSSDDDFKPKPIDKKPPNSAHRPFC